MHAFENGEWATSPIRVKLSPIFTSRKMPKYALVRGKVSIHIACSTDFFLPHSQQDLDYLMLIFLPPFLQMIVSTDNGFTLPGAGDIGVNVMNLLKDKLNLSPHDLAKVLHILGESMQQAICSTGTDMPGRY